MAIDVVKVELKSVQDCFIKCEADHRAKLHGRRQIMLNVHHHRHSNAAARSSALLILATDGSIATGVDHG